MLNYINIAFVLTFGLIVGSFLNVVILRSDDLKTIIADRSHCPKCKHTLGWYDLIPLFSYIYLRGKCRYCSKKISIQYPLVELIAAVIFILLFINFNFLAFIFYSIIFSLLLVVAVHDVKTQEIPSVFNYITILLLLSGAWHFGEMTFANMLLGGLIGGGIPALLVFISKEKWMGAGDIEVGLVMGILLGYPQAFFGFFLACFLGSIVGVFYMLKKEKTLTSQLAFAPYLILSAFISLLWGEGLVRWYMNSLT